MTGAGTDSAIRPKHPIARTVAEARAFLGLPPQTNRGHPTQITGIAVDSRAVLPGDLFVAAPGSHAHGAGFSGRAHAAGAVAVLTDRAGISLARQQTDLPLLEVDSVQQTLGHVCRWFYGTDRHALTTFAVTGTNGKTSTVHDLQSVLEAVGVATAISSTVRRSVGSSDSASTLTTPEAPVVHSFLARSAEADLDAAVIEVSAHALDQGRVDGIHFDVVGFTNLSHDHLDDFESLEKYAQTKFRLFAPERTRRAVITVDDEWGRRAAAASRVATTTLARASVDASAQAPSSATASDWVWRIVAETDGAADLEVAGRDGRCVMAHVAQIGEHFAANAALAIVMAVEAGYDPDAIELGLARRGGISPDLPGRLERVSGATGPCVFVDYAHTPDALERTLRALRRVTTGSLITLFGADGDRDTTKRPAMMRAVSSLSDITIVTDYNPRTENPAAIRAQLLSAAAPDSDVREDEQPAHAIRTAIALAGPDDTVLWAGPGHECTIEGADGLVDYSARDDARRALVEAGWPGSAARDVTVR